MSKQSEAKAAQGYRTEPDKCANCAHYRVDQTVKSYQAWDGLREWVEEKNMHCDLGGFAVKKTATCDRWEKAQGGASHG